MKQKILKVIISLIFLIIFNLLFFIFGGTERTVTEWISYGFIHFSYLCIVGTRLFWNKGNGRTVLNWSLYVGPVIYFTTELIAGCVFIIFFPEELIWASAVQSVTAGIFLIFQFANVIANNATDSSLKKQMRETIYMKSLASDVREAMLRTENQATKKMLKEIYDMLDAAPVGSCPEAEEAEHELSANVSALCSNTDGWTAPQTARMIKEIKGTMRKRNDIITRKMFA